MDAGEPGIPGVTITLSGTTSGGVDVCVAISPNPCDATTDSTGAYNFIGLPASNGAGYTLTEQSQALSTPFQLSRRHRHGRQSRGQAWRSMTGSPGLCSPPANSAATTTSANGQARSSGRVYLDVNDNGVFDAGDSGIAGVTITLSGTTASGANVCTVIPELHDDDASGRHLQLHRPACGHVRPHRDPAR